MDIKLWADDKIKIDPENNYFLKWVLLLNVMYHNLSGNPKIVIYSTLLYFYFSGILQTVKWHFMIFLLHLCT